jgi:hypothetical protein
MDAIGVISRHSIADHAPAGYRRRRAPGCCSCRDLTEPDMHWRRIRRTRRPDGSRRTQPDKSSWSSTGAGTPRLLSRDGAVRPAGAPFRATSTVPPATSEAGVYVAVEADGAAKVVFRAYLAGGATASRALESPEAPTALRTTGAGLAPRGTERADAGPPRWAGRGSTHMTRGSVAGCRRERSQSA